MGSVLSHFYSPSPLSLSPPSPSPSPSSPEIKYDVFLSFRGEDTRNNFTSHLYKAFRDKGIDAFIDYQLRSGKKICPSLLRAIDESQISVIIFSENYANSKWCLEELVKILECKKTHSQIVIPVFYEIDPSHVRNQTGSYALAFAGHQRRFKEDLDTVQKWRCALKEAADLSGVDSRVVVPESALVEKIVEDVLKWLNNLPSSDNDQLVGIESKITEIEAMLGMGDKMDNDVRKVGIYGLGGIGKTTLAKAVFRKIHCQLEGSYFTGSVREALEKKELNRLKQELYSAIISDGNSYIYTFTNKRLRQKKLLIIFDDVTSFKQIEDLVGDLDCLGSGSRIIIISRDHQVLKNCRVDDEYKVGELCFNNSFKLFCQYAFKQNCPKVDYKKLSRGLVKKVGGVPLALKVLGSFLLDKRKEVWKSSMKKLENSLDNDVYEVLKISYDGLDPDQQRIFLDVACFYKGWDVSFVKAILDASGFYTAIELSALVDKCLIIILDNKLMMHDLLEAMGKRIVQQESIDPGERTRLYKHNDIDDVLTKAMGTKTIEGISLDMSNIGNIQLHPHAFFNMHKLRFLRFYISHNLWGNNNNKLHVPQDFEFLLTELRYLQWDRCPLKSLVSNFHLKNLVSLNLSYGNVEQLWNGIQQFDHLKEIDLRGSKNLIRFPNLWAPKLERMILDDCASLIEMPSSFQNLTSLNFLSLWNCKSLRRIPDCTCLISLQYLSVDGCSKLERLPEIPNSINQLKLSSCTSLFEIASSFKHLYKLESLIFKGCESLISIPNLMGLKSLTNLDIKSCSKLEMLPEIPNNINQLQVSSCTSLFKISSSFKHHNKLWWLTFEGCESLTSIPDLMGLASLKYLAIDSCSKLKVLPKFPSSVQELYLKEIPIEELPPSSEHLCTLLELWLIDCSRLKSLPSNFCMWKSLQTFKLKNCPNIGKLPYPIACLKSLDYLSVSRCEDQVVGSLLRPSIDFFHNNLRLLRLSECGITKIPDSVCCLTSLKELWLDGNHFERIPKSIINLANLWYLNISYCERLKVLPKLPWAHVVAHNCTSLQELSCPSFRNDIYALCCNFTNCFKLDRNSLDSFVKDVEHEMQAQFASCCQVYERSKPFFTLRYPDSEIPELFEVQSSGSFIDVKLPFDWIDYNFLCFANCVVVSFPDQCNDDTWVELGYDVKSKKGGDKPCDVWDGFYDSFPCSTSSSHVVIWFDLHCFRELHDDELRFHFWRQKGCKVEKCGVHLIFGKPIEKSYESEADEPYPKRLNVFNSSNSQIQLMKFQLISIQLLTLAAVQAILSNQCPQKIVDIPWPH